MAKKPEPPKLTTWTIYNAEDGATVFAHACQLGAEGIVSKKIGGT
jgi:ATP-dependent DNA ligase